MCIRDSFRTDAAWDYGFPELAGQKEKIKNSCRVAVPGCYASGFISIARPLVELGLVPAEYPFSCTGISGYSGGGKKMIAEYESADRPVHSKLDADVYKRQRMERGGRAIFRRIKRKRNPGLFQGQTAHKRVPGFLFLRCEFFPCAVVRTCLRTGCMCPEYILCKCIKYEYILQITHKDAT